MTGNPYDIYVTIPPDGGYGWVIAFISFMGFTIADGIGNSFFLYRDRIAEYLEISTTMSAAIGSTFASLCLFMGPISSAISNRYGFRCTLITGGILTSVGTALTYFSKSFPLTLLLFGITAGVGGGFALIPITAPIGYWFDQKRPIALGLSSSGSGFGMLLIPFTTNIIMNLYDFKMAFLYHAALYSIYIILGVFLISLIPLKLETAKHAKPRGVYPTKRTSHDKYHPPVSELFPPEALQITPADPWLHASMSRRFKSSSIDGNYSYHDRILPRPTLDSNSVQTESTPELLQRICNCCTRENVGHRPLYKTDIFYQGSVYRISQAKKIPQDKAIDYAMSVTRLPTKLDVAQEEVCCVCYPEAVKRTINTMFDFSLLKELTFLLYLTSNVFFTMGTCLPVLYIYNRAHSHGFSEHILAWLVPTIGIGIFIGRITAGTLLQLFPLIHAFDICLAVNCAAALLTFGINLFQIIFYYFFYTTTFGIFFGIFTSIRSLIIVDYLGLNRLTSATGISFAFGGFALLIAPLIAGY